MIFETVQEWAHCREAMLEAIARCEGTHTEDDVLAMLLHGKLKLLRENNSGIVLEVIEYPRVKVLHCFLAAGDLKDVLKLEERLPEIAKSLGCSRITLCGRHGWRRILPDRGWKDATTIIMQKEV